MKNHFIYRNVRIPASLTLLLFFIINLFTLKTEAQQKIDINGNNVVPKITFPGITQTDFQDAFNVLNECLVTSVPVHGFIYPFMCPGGNYGKTWWQLDGSLTLSGTKWVNQKFAENVLRNFIEVQKPDGRIPLYGPDHLPQLGSSLPKLFEVAYDILRRTNDAALVRSTYNCLKKYLDWWLSNSVRRDSVTGLITGVFEESFPAYKIPFFKSAQVDLNVEVAIGCKNVAKLAQRLGDTNNYEKYSRHEKEIRNSINKYMWIDSLGAYYSYDIQQRKYDNKLICYTFDPLRNCIAPENNIKKLIEMLTNDKYFNWEKNPITSVAKTDTIFNERVGVYNGTPAWEGDIWTLRNETVIQGLEDIGRYDLASHLSYKTVLLFNNNYAEYIKPSDGKGEGQPRYGWSASQYIETIIEKIFGVDYDGFNKTITIMPNLDEELIGKEIALDSLLLPNGNRLNLSISTNKNHVFNIKYNIADKNDDMDIVVALPINSNIEYIANDKQNNILKAAKVTKGAAYIYRLDNDKKYSDEINFIPKL
jgi:hypothetical protein